MSHLSEVWDTEKHTIGRDQQTGLVIGRQHMWQPIGLNAFTGCDTVSAFASRRKLSALKPMEIDIADLDTFSQVGQSWDVQPQLSEKVKQFTCRMYVAASSTTEVNDLRCQLLYPKRREIESGCYHLAEIVSSCTSFEPTTRQQAGRAVYMLVPHCPTLPSVDDYMMMANSIAIHWMRSPSAPDAVLELLVYKCVRSCKLTKCTFIANRLAFTDMCCKLQSCSNQK